MGTTEPQQPITFPERTGQRLDSWKEIAAYLKRDERTVRRWEAEGLPVHRKLHKKQASVFAYRAEIDAWWHDGRQRLELETVMAPHRTKRWWMVAAVGLTVVALAALVLMLKSPRQPKVLRYAQITSDARLKNFLVTDGSRIYFDEEVGGHPVLHEVSTEGGEAVAIPTSLKDAWLWDISRDGSRLLVTDDDGSNDSPLWIVNLPDGSPHRVGDVVANGAAWSPDGQRIAYLRGREIYVVQGDGTGNRRLVSMSVDVWHLRWSPDGKVLRFGLMDVNKTDSALLWEVSVDGSRLHPLLADWKDGSAELRGNWTANGKYYAFISSKKGATSGVDDLLGDVWVLREKAGIFDRVSHSPMQLTDGPMEFAEVLPSRDGKRVFVLGKRARGELVHYDSRSGQFVSYLSGISVEAVDFSRDGQYATYVTYPEGGLWRSRVDGNEKLQLTTFPMQIAAPRWSPDGRRIAFMAQFPGKPWKIYLISANGGNPEQLIPGGGGEETPSWSPDGNSLAFGRVPESAEPGDARVGLLDLRTRQISLLAGSEGLGSPHWSPDGRYLACQNFNGNFLLGTSDKLTLFDFITRKWTALADVIMEWPSWSRDGKYIYFVRRAAVGTAQFRFRVGDHMLEQVLDIKDLHQAWGPFGPWSALAPDDSLLAMRDVGTMDIYALDLQLP